MNYEVIEKSISDRLKNVLNAAGFHVAVMPEVQAEYKSTTQRGAVYVSYQRSKFDQTSDDPRHFSTGPTSQKEVLNFEVTIEAAKLRGNGGVHKAVELVRTLLIGFRPTNCHKLYMVEVRPETWAENLWSWKVLMACQSAAIEAPEDDEEALITRIRLENEEFNETVQAPPEP